MVATTENGTIVNTAIGLIPDLWMLRINQEARQGIVDYIPETGHLYLGEGWQTILGDDFREGVYTREEFFKQIHEDELDRFKQEFEPVENARDQAFSVDCQLRKSDNEHVWVRFRGTRITLPNGMRRIGACAADISSYKQSAQKAQILGTKDPLTGLPNRALMRDRLEKALAEMGRKNTKIAFIFIDLDKFKPINDTYGHQAGDELLKEIGRRLAKCIRANDTVARIGGDEFAIVLEDIDDEASAQSVAEAILKAVNNPVIIGSIECGVGCSLGLAIAPMDGLDVDTIMHNADSAMYHAKQAGRNNFQFFSGDMNRRATERQTLEQFLQFAIANKELYLVYQPYRSLETGDVIGVESFLRWRHPKLGLLSPDDFMGAAEVSGLIAPLGEWALQESCKQVAKWQLQLGRKLAVSVNIAEKQLKRAGLVNAVDSALEQSGLNVKSLALDFDASWFFKAADESAATLDSLYRKGLTLTLEGFGVGSTDIAALRRRGIQLLKLNFAELLTLHGPEEGPRLLSGLAVLGRTMNCALMAARVETEAHRALAKKYNFDAWQGNLGGPPMSVADMAKVLKLPADSQN